MKILLTGSEGVIGSCLSGFLKAAGHKVFRIDLMHKAGERGWEHPMLSQLDSYGSYARADVSEYRQISRVFSDFGPFDLVYHMAAEFGRWNGEDYYEQLWKTNVIGTKHIIRLQEAYKFKLVHFSSSEVYGDYEDVMSESVMEKVAIAQLNDYAMTKWVNEMQIKNSIAQHETNSVIVRLFNTYGPGEWYHPYRSVNAKFCHHALYGLPVTVYRNHNRTSTYLDDACRALAHIAEVFKPGEVYNVGGGTLHSIEEVVDIIWKHTGASRDLITLKDSEILTTKQKLVDNTKAVTDLGFQVSVSLEEGLKRTLNWMSTV